MPKRIFLVTPLCKAFLPATKILNNSAISFRASPLPVNYKLCFNSSISAVCSYQPYWK